MVAELFIKKYTLIMKKIIAFVLVFFCVIVAYSQPLPDSSLNRYNAAHTQKDKTKYLFDYLWDVVSADSNDVNKALDLLAYFNTHKDEAASDCVQAFIASRLNRRGDYSTGLNMTLPILLKFEKRKDTLGILTSLKVISNCYEFAKNFEQAIVYARKTIDIAVMMNDEKALSNTYNDLGATYAKMMMPDSGIIYAQKAVSIDSKMKDEYNLIFSLGTLAENYMANKDFDLALPFLRKVLHFGSLQSTPWGTAYTFTDLAQTFLGLKQYDSSIYYGQKAIQASRYMGYKETLLKSYEAIYKSFEESNRSDSANKFFHLATAAKDSIYSIEKTNSIQATSFREQLRQQEIEKEKLKTAEERRSNIQYAAIAIGLILFILFFLLLSRSIIVNEKWISFLGILGLLISFEFINLLFHPYLEKLTGRSPVLMLAILVVIAALLIPFHHRLEHWVKNKMVEKNKKIRLASAKKTIEQLER